MRKIVVTGSLAFDQIMNFPGKFRDHILPDKLHILNVSFLVETLRRERGGTAGSISYNLALMGLRPKVIAAIGGDGVHYVDQLKQAGVDTSGIKVFADEQTAVGTVMTDVDDNQIWAFYPGAMKRASEMPLVGVTAADLVILPPNDPRAVVKYVEECVKRKIAFMYDPAGQIPAYTPAQIKFGVENAKFIIGNDYEISLIERKIRNPKSEIRKDQIWITTLGAKGAVIESDGQKYKVAAAKVKNVSDPTGAGDAFRAGFLSGYLRGLSLQVCGQMGSVCAAYTVEKYGTQTHKFTLVEFKKRYQENFGDDPLRTNL